MPAETRSNRGGKRQGAGRKPNPAWLSLWWSGFKSGDLAMMRRAGDMQAEAEALEQASSAKPPPAPDPSNSMAGTTARLRASSRRTGAPGVGPDQQRLRARWAKKQRNYRARQEAGIVILRIPVIETDLADTLINEGHLSPHEALDRDRVAQVLGELIEEWIKRRQTQHCDFM